MGGVVQEESPEFKPVPPKQGLVEWLKRHLTQVLVAYDCNPTYLGGRDQEDHSSKPVWANSETLSRKYLTQKGLVEWLKV
jgi:hypothetical protein